MEQQEYLDKFEQTLIRELVNMATLQGRLSGQILPSPDLDDKWESLVQPYLGDAVKEIEKYPTVALGWMMYLGMAVAKFWDVDWETFGGIKDLYAYIRDKRGFDCMDEHVRETILGLRPKEDEYSRLEDFVRSCAMLCLTHIRHENVEPQSPMAFHIYVRCIHTLYIVGISVVLHRVGYKMSAG